MVRLREGVMSMTRMCNDAAARYTSPACRYF
jgi:hypothetical protein